MTTTKSVFIEEPELREFLRGFVFEKKFEQIIVYARQHAVETSSVKNLDFHLGINALADALTALASDDEAIPEALESPIDHDFDKPKAKLEPLFKK